MEQHYEQEKMTITNSIINRKAKQTAGLTSYLKGLTSDWHVYFLAERFRDMSLFSASRKVSLHYMTKICLKISGYFSSALIVAILAGCEKSPAEQCLESFRDDLVSPRSAKTVKLVDEELTYLAKNRNGVEVQGKAICAKFGDKWMRDSARETIRTLDAVAKSLKAYNNCREEGQPGIYCEMMYPTVTPEMARIKLGYN